MQKLFNISWRFKGFVNPWEQRKLGDVIKWKSGAGISKSDLKNNGKNKVIHYADLYKMPEIINAENILHRTDSTSGEKIDYNSLLFPKSDVTPKGLARTSSIKLDNVFAGNDVLMGKINEENSSDFLSFQINLNKDNILKYITGSTIRHINSKSLSKLTIKTTEIDEQKRIAKFIEKINKLIDSNERKVSQLKQLKKYLMQKMLI